MELLKRKLNKLINELSSDKREIIKKRLSNLISIYPFNEFEYMISSLLSFKKINLNDYYEIRDEYIARNMYLYIFEISSPRGFGEQWAQGHLKELIPELIKPSKKLDKNYSGEYDFILPYKKEIIKIEVKASRAVDSNKNDSLYIKALSCKSKKSFWMNFQQVKPNCCHVFVWIAVWRDIIKYWVISSNDLKKNKYYSKGQHRGNKGEGQIHIKNDNIKEFDIYRVKSNRLKESIINTYNSQKKLK